MNKKIISIISVVVIIIIITGIWVVKNNKKEEEKRQELSNAQNINPDFKLNVTNKIDMEKLKSYKMPMIIDFGADSCAPCKLMEPDLKALNSDLQEKAIIKFADVWKYRNLAQGYPVEVIPTQIFIDNTGEPYKPVDINKYNLEIVKDKEGKHLFTTHIGPLTKVQMLDILKEMGLNE